MGMTDAALQLLARARSAAEVRAALAAVPPGPKLRELLLQRYDELAAAPRRDPGTEVRAALLAGLRPLLTAADRGRLEAALLTYEFGAHKESGSRLRAAALLALDEIDPDAAEWHAIHLLSNQYTEPMSGEPAATALRLLAAHGAGLPIYLHVLAGSSRQELLAEALRALTGVPGPLLAELASRFLESEDEIALVGLFDLITSHPDPGAFTAFVGAFAVKTDSFDVLRFAAAQIVATRREPLIGALRTALELTPEEDRRSVLAAALGVE